MKHVNQPWFSDPAGGGIVPKERRCSLFERTWVTRSPSARPIRSWALTIAACAVGKSIGERSGGVSSAGKDAHDHLRDWRSSRMRTLTI